MRKRFPDSLGWKGVAALLCLLIPCLIAVISIEKRRETLTAGSKPTSLWISHSGTTQSRSESWSRFKQRHPRFGSLSESLGFHSRRSVTPASASSVEKRESDGGNLIIDAIPLEVP